MAVTPEAIFQSAVVLARGDEEVDWRNACSRAYYAAYHRCRAIANEIEPYTETAGRSAHRVVADILTSPGSGKARMSMGYKLRQCGAQRRRADYEIDDPFPRQAGLAVIADCREILEAAGTDAGSDERADLPISPRT